MRKIGKVGWIGGFLIFGIVTSIFLFPLESERVKEHLIGYPDSDVFSHLVRPYLLVLLCFLPALGSVLYYCSSIIDRYLIRELLRCFGICFAAFFSLLILMEVQNNGSDVADASTKEAVGFFLIQLPAMMMMILPYSLMLSLLWCLGKLSKSQEIVSMIQSGRSMLRIMSPLLVFGLFLTVTTMVFSYHWAPFAEGYKRALLRELKGEPETAATNVGYQDPDLQRMWTVGYYEAETALWLEASRSWELKNGVRWTFRDENNQIKDSPKAELFEEVTLQLKETPWQIIRPGLEPTHLGIPELASWIQNHPQHPFSNVRRYKTWWHFRWAQPIICIIIVLLAAPLGISFTRRGSGGGIAIAIFLCAGMLFCSTVFPTLGESGHLKPELAAWMTNILFFLVAIFLFYRRANGLTIHQMFCKILPFK